MSGEIINAIIQRVFKKKSKFWNSVSIGRVGMLQLAAILNNKFPFAMFHSDR